MIDYEIKVNGELVATMDVPDNMNSTEVASAAYIEFEELIAGREVLSVKVVPEQSVNFELGQ